MENPYSYYLCKCGCPEMCHQQLGLYEGRRECLVSDCKCTDYKRDNLRYLEKLSDE